MNVRTELRTWKKVGLEDPPKPGVLGAIKAIQSAGVSPAIVMYF